MRTVAEVLDDYKDNDNIPVKQDEVEELIKYTHTLEVAVGLLINNNPLMAVVIMAKAKQVIEDDKQRKTQEKPTDSD